MLIHVEPIHLIETSSRIEYSVQDMFEFVHALRVCANRLDMDWQGTVADEVQVNLAEITGGLNRQVQQLHDLGRTMRRQAESWMETDELWVQQYRETGEKGE